MNETSLIMGNYSRWSESSVKTDAKISVFGFYKM